MHVQQMNTACFSVEWQKATKTLFNPFVGQGIDIHIIIPLYETLKQTYPHCL